MAKIIVSCRYKKSAKGMKKLIRYMATREGVEKLGNSKEYQLASASQMKLVQSVVNHFPQSKTFLEYADYDALPTQQNAHEFLDAVAERYADRTDELKGLVGYISQRPGVEKLGTHGLFTQFDIPINLDLVAKKVSQHDGLVWTEVISLRREDAERLHFNNAEAWKNLVRRNMNEIAKAHRIKPEDLQWYGAFHNTTHHPHIHLIVFSKGTEGYLSEKGIKDLRRAFGQDIFRDEQYKQATIETSYRNELKVQLRDLLEQIYDRRTIPKVDYYLQILQKVQSAVKETKGKKLYGYLPRKVKTLVDFAVHELAKDECLKALYEKWNEVNREKLSLYYDSKDSEKDMPIEKNTEFRSLKNMIIKTALSMDFSMENTTNPVRVGFLFSLLARQISEAANRKLDALNHKMPLADSKERMKIQDKKLAHGQREGSDTEGDDDEVYDSQAFEGILAGLDYIIQEAEYNRRISEYVENFPHMEIDRAYQEYLDSLDEQYNEENDENYDEDDEQGFGLSM